MLLILSVTISATKRWLLPIIFLKIKMCLRNCKSTFAHHPDPDNSSLHFWLRGAVWLIFALSDGWQSLGNSGTTAVNTNWASTAIIWQFCIQSKKRSCSQMVCFHSWGTSSQSVNVKRLPCMSVSSSMMHRISWGAHVHQETLTHSWWD